MNIYDNASRDPALSAIKDFADIDLVEYAYVSRRHKRHHLQVDVYNWCLARYGFRHKFVGLIDTDEFVVIEDGGTLSTLLSSYTEFGALALNWRLFGSSGHDYRPDGGILSNYNKCFAANNTSNRHVKVSVAVIETRINVYLVVRKSKMLLSVHSSWQAHRECVGTRSLHACITTFVFRICEI